VFPGQFYSLFRTVRAQVNHKAGYFLLGGYHARQLSLQRMMYVCTVAESGTGRTRLTLGDV
jgi:hypothetical protein